MPIPTGWKSEFPACLQCRRFDISTCHVTTPGLGPLKSAEAKKVYKLGMTLPSYPKCSKALDGLLTKERTCPPHPSLGWLPTLQPTWSQRSPLIYKHFPSQHLITSPSYTPVIHTIECGCASSNCDLYTNVCGQCSTNEFEWNCLFSIIIGWENSPLALHGTRFWRGSFFPSLDEPLPPKSHDNCKLVNGWVWFEYLCKVWGLKTWQLELGICEFNACTGQKVTSTEKGDGLSISSLTILLEWEGLA